MFFEVTENGRAWKSAADGESMKVVSEFSYCWNESEVLADYWLFSKEAVGEVEVVGGVLGLTVDAGFEMKMRGGSAADDLGTWQGKVPGARVRIVAMGAACKQYPQEQ